METELKIINYSEKAVAVQADYECAFQAEFKLLGGRFNSRLSFGAGWIFSRKKSETALRLMFQHYELTVADIELSDLGVSTSGGGNTGSGSGKNVLPDFILSAIERKDYSHEVDNYAPDEFYKTYPIVVRLSGSECVPIEQRSLETEFWIPDEGHDKEIEMAHTEEYFINRNTEKYKNILDILQGKKETGPRYPWLVNWCSDRRNHWSIDKSYISPDAVNAIESLDIKKHDMHRDGLYRKLSEEDRRRLITAYKLMIDATIKRCRSWLKRYGAEKLSVRTYWADR